MSMIFSKETILTKKMDNSRSRFGSRNIQIDIQMLLKIHKKSDDIFFLEIDNCVILVFKV